MRLSKPRRLYLIKSAAELLLEIGQGKVKHI